MNVGFSWYCWRAVGAHVGLLLGEQCAVVHWIVTLPHVRRRGIGAAINARHVACRKAARVPDRRSNRVGGGDGCLPAYWLPGILRNQQVQGVDVAVGHWYAGRAQALAWYVDCYRHGYQSAP